jgi:intein/homing endonuclease
LLLDTIIEDGNQIRLKTVNAYDILMHCADAVLSGGIRRSACSVIFDAQDKDMMNAKTGNWFLDNPQRARSNNSAIIIRGKTSYEEFETLINKTKEFGEPGFLYVVDENQLLNPCIVGDTLIATSNGLFFAESLVGNKFEAKVDGKQHSSTDKGFWQTGLKKTITLKLSSGRKLELTHNHKVMTSSGWIEAGDLMVGDFIKINNQRGSFNIDNSSQDFAKGYLLGSFLADGNIGGEGDRCEIKFWGEDKEEYREKAYNFLKSSGWISNHHKQISESNSDYSVISSSKLFNFAQENGCLSPEKHLSKSAISGKSPSFLSGLISGYFDADGSVAQNSQKGNSIRILSSQLTNLENLQIVLNYFGIFSKIYNNRLPEGFRTLPDGNNGYKEYYCKATHEICISCDNIEEFEKNIHPINKEKSQLIKDIISSRKRTANKTSWLDEVVNITENQGVKMVYDAEINEVHAFDANSLYVHNCFEISFIPITKDGRCGFQFCNLTSINGAKVESLEDFKNASWAASLIGTLQAAYTTFPYLGHTSEELTEQEALLGVSITGMMDNPEVLFNPEYQREAAKVSVNTNIEWAKKIGINQASRVTCIKPEGTNSIVLSAASGIHPHHARKYFRRIQVNKEDNVYKFFKMFNEHACEESVWSANKVDDVITFPIEVGENVKIKSELNAIEHLELIKLTQTNWVNCGTTISNKKPLNHSVSCTVIVKDDEWKAVTEYLYKNQEYFTAVSLLPYSGDKIYQQAPMEAIVTPEDEVRFNKLQEEWSKVDFTKLIEDEDETSHTQEAACAGGKCEPVSL